MIRSLFVVACMLLSMYCFSQQSDLIRVERKVNQANEEIQSIQDSLDQVNERIDDQFLELQRTKELVAEENDVINNRIDRINEELGLTSDAAIETSDVDRFWLVFCAALVFLMQAGFKVLEMGMVRTIHGKGIGLKNLIDFTATAVIYYLIGFSFMFGSSQNGFIGSGLFLPTAQELEAMFTSGVTDFGLEFFLFQMAFAATAATIVSGAMSERTALVPYLVIAIFVAGFVYPIVGHMAWGDLFLSKGKAWLTSIGFIDFAGSTVVHSTGAWVGLIGIWIIGPRLGRFKADGSVNREKFKSSSFVICLHQGIF